MPSSSSHEHLETTSNLFVKIAFYTYIVLFAIWPPVFASLSGYFRDTNQPDLDVVFFRIHCNLSVALLLGLFFMVTTMTLRFQRAMKRVLESTFPSPLQNQAKKASQGPTSSIEGSSSDPIPLTC